MGITKRNVIITYRLAAAILAWVAICAQLTKQIVSGYSITNFFSYFTVQSNLIGIVVLAAGAAVLLNGNILSRSFQMWRGAAVFYLLVTGIVYALLLSHATDAQGIMAPWIDTVLHRVMPAVMLFDWLFDRPRVAFARGLALLWLVYPLAYFAYSLIRGPIVKWYPYPFLDPSHGYLKVALTSAAIAVAGALLALLIGLWPRPARGQLEVDSAGKTIKD